MGKLKTLWTRFAASLKLVGIVIASTAVLAGALFLAIYRAFRKGVAVGQVEGDAKSDIEHSEKMRDEGDTEGLRDEILKRTR